ncbi:hypothetical protein ACWGFX_06100 [Streptomyces xanthophaeus]|uniref:hypothetical protein n=1 Tax=Streptomyces xanthophaeus TaxID=67385 RepID=UPI000689880F|nr:hypothetical protein [Streptomyces xanthophaeus]
MAPRHIPPATTPSRPATGPGTCPDPLLPPLEKVSEGGRGPACRPASYRRVPHSAAVAAFPDSPGELRIDKDMAVSLGLYSLCGLLRLSSKEPEADTDLTLMRKVVGEWLLMLARHCRPREEHTIVRLALGAALTARAGAVHGDTDAVDTFSRTWLGLAQPERWREAVEMALLGDWVSALGGGAATATTVVSVLRHDAETEHLRLQPLWERRVQGRRTALLGQPVGGTWTLEDLLVDHRTPESQTLAAERSDSRLAVVLRALHPDEESTAWTWAEDGTGWDRAAVAAGHPASYGERVRRKLKRLGTRYTVRAQAAVETQGGGDR